MSAGLLSLAPPGSAATPEGSLGTQELTGPTIEAQDAARAHKAAVRAGKPVEITSQRTETDEVYANPDGTYRVDRSIVPVRVRHGADLVAIDPTLVERPDGRLAPKASAMGVSFSPGGDGAFATMVRDGRTVSLTWPHGKLPKPTTSGGTATYADVLPGVDLTATVGSTAFSHALVVKTRAAAKNPMLRAIDFGLRTNGAEVTGGSGGEVLVKTPSRNTLFVAPRPHMWDSGGSEPATAVDPKTPKSALPTKRSLPDALNGAEEGARQAALAVKVGEGKLTVTPDTALLDDPKTVYPVVIDPVWAPDAWKNAWSIAYTHSAYPSSGDTVYWNGGTISDYARVGYANDTQIGGTVRANTYFRVSTANTWGKQVIKSTLRIKQTHAGSWSCDSGDLLVRDIGNRLPTNITYNKQPAWGAVVDASGESFGGRNCPADTAGLVELDVTPAIAKAASGKWSYWAFVLTSKSNTIDVSWRKFDPNSARISTYLNTPPAKPTMSIDPLVPCAGGTVGTTDQITLRAQVKDADENGLKAEFRYGSTATAGYTSKIVDVSSGSIAIWRIPAGTTLKSGTYWYDVIVRDAVSNSPWAGRCQFTYDWERPSKKPTVSSVQFPEDVAQACPSSDGSPCTNPARTDGTFLFTANGVPDVTEFVWWTDSDTRERAVKATTTGGSASVPFRPLHAGPQHLYVRSEDAANNRSDTKVYQLIPSRAAARDRLGDTNGDTNVDLVNVDPGTGQLWTYPGRGDGTFGTGVLAHSISFADATTTNGGSWDDADYYEDVIALRPAADDPTTYELWAYRGAGDGTLDQSAAGVRRLTTLDEGDKESGENNSAHWRHGAQIISVSSFNDDNRDDALTDGDDPDLLVKEGGSLWLYLGKRGSEFLDENPGGPIALGNANWQNMTIMAPGDLNKDGLPEIWARDTTTGAVYQYTSRRATTPDPNATTLADLSVYGDPAQRQAIGSGLTGAAYPHLTTSGDFEGDSYPDLWSRDGTGKTIEFPGRALTSGSSFGPARALVTTGLSWADCEAVPAASGGTATFQICGPILGKFKALGGVAFGKPTSGVTTVSDGGRYVNFARPGITTTDRAISWSNTTGAWPVQGANFTQWVNFGRESGLLGYPTAGERPTNVQSGAFSTFSKAGRPSAIYWSSGTGSHAIRNGIYSRYVELGGVASYGYPTMDEAATATKPGAYQNFRNGVTTGDNVSFYWSSATGAWPVTGGVRSFWLSLDGHNGALGFPTSPEYTVFGGRRSDFQTAYIRWNRESGHVAQHSWEDGTSHLRTDLSGDVDGDGRTDIITAYNYEDATTGLYVANANGDGGHNPPQEVWSAEAGGFDYTKVKWASGDFNSDGRDDVAALYGYADGAVAIWSFLSQAAGPPRTVRSAMLPAGTWNWSLSSAMAGDVNGDGRDDLVLPYNYGGGVTGIFKALARTDGTFDNPAQAFKSNAGEWDSGNAAYTVGDTNGDGRDDVVAYYRDATGAGALFTFTAKPDGSLNAPMRSWSVPDAPWAPDLVRMTAADFNLDGREDVVVLIPVGPLKVHLFQARSDGGFDTYVTSYAGTLSGEYASHRMENPVPGDVNGDKRPDLTLSHNPSSGETRVYTLYGNEKGTVDRPTSTWFAEAGTW
ncbi:FG-GAP-like repeat-containing protein [Streptomyces sp. NPDC057411]|uniref:FG-GAP-like repeat-containing protein n=1 Tax=unclassified Streptomyces TaxID=2593676 RepID=UPI00363D2912